MLSDTEILKLIKLERIKIEPFDIKRLGPVSYDLTTIVDSRKNGIYKLVTKETIKLSRNCIGICSARSRLEIRGLFSAGSILVDPGYEGKLTFLVSAPGRELQDLRYMMGDLFQIMFMRVDGKVGIAYNERKTSTAMDREGF